MRGTMAFAKKEAMEHVRSYRLLILWLVLFIFGMLSSLLAKMTPEIIAQFPVEGMEITLPLITYLDAYVQFFSNMGEMGLPVMLLVFSGLLSHEFTKGTLVIPLSKGLSRQGVILGKYGVAVALWAVGCLMAALVHYGYTRFLFGPHLAASFPFAVFCLWLFGAFLLAVLFFASVFIRGNYGGLLFTAAVFVVLVVLNVLPPLREYTPLRLISENAAIVAGNGGDMLFPILVAVALAALSLLFALIVFAKKTI